MRTGTLVITLLSLAGTPASAQGLLTPPSRVGIHPMNAGHIFVFRYQGVSFGKNGQEQTSAGPGWSYREATLTLTIEEELRGRLLQHRGVPFQHAIHDIPSTVNYTNLWGNRWRWKTGVRLLAICDGSSDDAKALLVDQHCEDFSEREELIDDTRVIAELEKSKTPLAGVLQVARTQAAKRNSSFAYYVGARIGLEPLNDKALSMVMDLVAAQQTPWPARTVYASVVSRALLSIADPPQPALETQWIRTLFRLYSSPPPSLPPSERDTYARPFIWNALRLTPRALGLPPPSLHSADEVFQTATAERAAAIAAVRNHVEVPWKQPILNWLLGTPTP